MNPSTSSKIWNQSLNAYKRNGENFIFIVINAWPIPSLCEGGGGGWSMDEEAHDMCKVEGEGGQVGSVDEKAHGDIKCNKLLWKLTKRIIY